MGSSGPRIKVLSRVNTSQEGLNFRKDRYLKLMRKRRKNSIVRLPKNKTENKLG